MSAPLQSQLPPTTTTISAVSSPPVPDLHGQDMGSQPEAHGRNAFNSERPLGVTPVPEGGVAIGGRPNLPEGRANLADKLVGKAQKVTGKYTHNPELHEKGELRETGGKNAAEGRARAAHD